VSAYIYHTVPVVLQCWFRHGTNFRAALEEIILCGGDTDTTAAILGGIIGAEIGSDRLPLDWQEGLVDFPNTRAYIQRVANEMAAARTAGIAVVAPRLLFGVPLLRNIVFVGILLVHAVRRGIGA
jgi:ADP-ribosyl-[dinitrogen reductase] hydrolase